MAWGQQNGSNHTKSSSASTRRTKGYYDQALDKERVFRDAAAVTHPGKCFGGFNVETGGFKQAELSRNNEPEHAETTRGHGSIGKHEHLRLTSPRRC